MKGALNLFQRNMLRWRAMHPYNAVHAVAIDPAVDDATLRAVIAAELERCALTGLVLDGRRGRYEYRGGPASVQLGVVTGARAEDALEAEMERQLNAPFPADGPLDPFRFFHIVAADGAMLGLAYDHFIAGGDSILALLHAIVARAAGRVPSSPAPDLYPPTEGPLFRRHWGKLFAGLARLPGLTRRARGAVRPRYADIMDGHVGYRLHALSPMATARLMEASRRLGVTVNDLLIALLLLALDPLVPQRRSATRRVSLAVASIMNLRAEFGRAGAAAFGQFLGSLHVYHPVPEGATLEDVARDVHAQTTEVKSARLYLQTLLAMRYAQSVWPLLKPRQRADFYAKAYPTLVGLSALNVNAMWTRPNEAVPPPVYIRGVPTGPLAPLAVAVTTVGDVLYAGFSHRTTAFGRDDVDKLWSGLTRRLENFK